MCSLVHFDHFMATNIWVYIDVHMHPICTDTYLVPSRVPVLESSDKVRRALPLPPNPSQVRATEEASGEGYHLS